MYEACCMGWAESLRGIEGYPSSSIEDAKRACASIRELDGMPGAEDSCEKGLDGLRQGAAAMEEYPGWETPPECRELADAQIAKTCNDLESLSSCTHYAPEALGLLGVGFFRGMCELVGGRWGTEPCPTADAVGACDDGSGTLTTYYSTGDLAYDAVVARESCVMIDGVFVDRPPSPQDPSPSPSPAAEPEPASPNPPETTPNACYRYEACCMAWADSLRVIDGYPLSAIEDQKAACASIRSLEGIPGAEDSCERALEAMREGAAGMSAYPEWESPTECR